MLFSSLALTCSGLRGGNPVLAAIDIVHNPAHEHFDREQHVSQSSRPRIIVLAHHARHSDRCFADLVLVDTVEQHAQLRCQLSRQKQKVPRDDLHVRKPKRLISL